MSAVQSSAELGLTNLTPELKKPVEATDKPRSGAVSDLSVSNTEESVTANVQERASHQKPLTPVQLEKVAQQLQDFVGEMNRGLEFSVDKDSGRDVIKVIDKTSGDLVKQFPSEEVLTLVAKLSEMVGGFIDAKV